jgi:hypothetical protein
VLHHHALRREVRSDRKPDPEDPDGTGIGFHLREGRSHTQGGNIVEDVLREIAQSEIIIADLSSHNPNVFYELGIVQMVKDGNKVILLIEQGETVPFGVTNFRVIAYKRSPAGMRSLKEKLISAVIEADALRFELRGSPGRYKLPHKILGPDRLAYDFEITRCVYVQNAVKIDLDVTRHVIGEKPEVISHMSRGLNLGQRIELPGLKHDLQLERGTNDFAGFVFQRRG